MQYRRIILQSRVTLLLIAACMMAFTPVALAQTLAEAFAYAEALKIVEVRVHARSKPGGRGWALTGEERGIEYCYIVTPFHVIGDEVTRTVYSDIVVEGAGYRLGPRAQRIADDGLDLALLLLDREGSCPFIDGPSAGRGASGLWLVRLSDTKVREEIEGDARVPIAPVSENLDIAYLTVAAADRANFTMGWSGATVFRDGRRIGMVVEAADEGATARFYTAQGIVRAFRDQITIYERHTVMTAAQVPAAPPREVALGLFPSPGVGETFQDCPACPVMMVLPKGRFLMGSTGDVDEEETPQHEVTIPRPFAVGIREVSVKEFGAFVDEWGYDPQEGCWIQSKDGKVHDQTKRWRDPGYRQTERHPAVCVNWEDAQAYARWLSAKSTTPYRLLSEAEWEYAARGTTTTRYWWGDRIDSNKANCKGCGSRWDNKGSAPVGSFAKSIFGLSDTAGNVMEWVEDCKVEHYDGAPDDGGAWPSGDCDFRGVRGGSWKNNPNLVRSAARNWVYAGRRTNYIGFRVARTLP